MSCLRERCRYNKNGCTLHADTSLCGKIGDIGVGSSILCVNPNLDDYCRRAYKEIKLSYTDKVVVTSINDDGFLKIKGSQWWIKVVCFLPGPLEGIISSQVKSIKEKHPNRDVSMVLSYYNSGGRVLSRNRGECGSGCYNQMYDRRHVSFIRITLNNNIGVKNETYRRRLGIILGRLNKKWKQVDENVIEIKNIKSLSNLEFYLLLTFLRAVQYVPSFYHIYSLLSRTYKDINKQFLLSLALSLTGGSYYGLDSLFQAGIYSKSIQLLASTYNFIEGEQENILGDGGVKFRQRDLIKRFSVSENGELDKTFIHFINSEVGMKEAERIWNETINDKTIKYFGWRELK
jgi:hypothetical protein